MKSKQSKYLVGIDLGTTNCVMAYCPLTEDIAQSPIKIFEIDQLVGPGEVARRPMLPSFRFHAAPSHYSSEDLQLPWQQSTLTQDVDHLIIGQWACDLASQIQGRQVVSAKSWLSHQGVDRTQDILPWGAQEEVEQVSPILASASYLFHLHQCWNYHHPQAQLNDQELVITIPASFDETARKYTLEAAQIAGLTKVKLLEEPQAVCYDWYHRMQNDINNQLTNIDEILVCDIGGGTTDLSLIQVTKHDEELNLDRIGVGEHLMLGGDNIDLTLAHFAEHQLKKDKPFKTQELIKLLNQARQVKETLLQAKAPASAKISILGTGRKLIGGTQSATITQEQIKPLVLNGFFPKTQLTDKPRQKAKALVEFGLPYAGDPEITRHIADFLAQYQDNLLQDKKVPAALLLNGGIFNSPTIRQRLIEVLETWRGEPITLLDNPNPDLAVAYGAVAYAKARLGAQLKIGGGSARSYFLRLKQKNKHQGLCLLAKGTEENQEIRFTNRQFELLVGKPIQIDILTSTQDKLLDMQGNQVSSQNGLLINLDQNLEHGQFQVLPPYIATLEQAPQMLDLAPITKLNQGKTSNQDKTSTQAKMSNQAKTAAQTKTTAQATAHVFLACQLTDVGTLKIECVEIDNPQKRWQIEFDARQEEVLTQTKQHPRLEEGKALILDLYAASKKQVPPVQVKALSKSLEKIYGKREDWTFELSRTLFDTLCLRQKRRRRSDEHEKQWLRLTGYTLRPGFGTPEDAWRIEQIWPIYAQSLQFPSMQSYSDWWTFWRRISGGLNQAQQETILADIAKYLHPGSLRQKSVSQEAKTKGYEAMVRLAASLENLDKEDKKLLATWFFKRAEQNQHHVQAHWWAVARLSARTQLYGSAHNILTSSDIMPWLTQMLELNWRQEPMIGFCAMMMARKTGDRSLDIDENMRQKVIAKLIQSKAPQNWIELVESVKELTSAESKRLFGESLPLGLKLIQS